MNAKLEALFAEPEKSYLQPDELNQLSQFVNSLPERVSFYRRLRNEELTLLQPVADALEQRYPQESPDKLKRSLQNAILMLRCVAMAMLTDDPELVNKRLASWLPEMAKAFETQAIDQALHQLMREQLAGRFAPQQMALLQPSLDVACALLSAPKADEMVSTETLVSLF